jgi:hypothetical protein
LQDLHRGGGILARRDALPAALRRVPASPKVTEASPVGTGSPSSKMQIPYRRAAQLYGVGPAAQEGVSGGEAATLERVPAGGAGQGTAGGRLESHQTRTLARQVLWALALVAEATLGIRAIASMPP